MQVYFTAKKRRINPYDLHEVAQASELRRLHAAQPMPSRTPPAQKIKREQQKTNECDYCGTPREKDAPLKCPNCGAYKQ